MESGISSARLKPFCTLSFEGKANRDGDSFRGGRLRSAERFKVKVSGCAGSFLFLFIGTIVCYYCRKRAGLKRVVVLKMEPS